MRTWTMTMITAEQVPLYVSCGWACTRDLADTHHGRYRQYYAKWDDSQGEPIYPEEKSVGD